MMDIIKNIPKDLESIYGNLVETLEASVKNLREIYHTKDFGIAFSGGLDSSLLGYLAMKYLNPTFYVVGFEHSKDIENAIESLSLMFGEDYARRLKVIKITDDYVLEALKVFSKLGLEDVLTASFEVPLYIVLKHSDEKVIISGQGADELFGGYMKYLKDPTLMEEDFKRLLEVTITFEDKLAMLFQKTIARPYLSEEIITIAKSLPIKEKVYKGIRKLALRRVAYLLGLPEEIIKREKKAAQYGSGVMRSMRRIAKSLDIDLRDLLKVLSNES